MSDQSYTNKENAKSALLSAITDYLSAAERDGLDDFDQAAEIADLIFDAGKTNWSVEVDS